jgi:hypothetical protein
MASGLVVSQSTIIETYALASLLMVCMWAWRDNKAALIALGIVGLGVHHLIGLALLPILFQQWRNRTLTWHYALLGLGILWYLYLPLTNRPPFDDVWLRGDSLMDYVNYLFGQKGLVLGLAVYSPDALVRAADLAPIMVGGFAAALVPMLVRTRNDLLTWLTWLPIAHYAFGLPHVAYVYMMPAFAFGGVMAMEGVEIIKGWAVQHEWRKWLPAMVAAPALFLMALNLSVFNIGGQLDPELTASQFYEDLHGVNTEAVVWTYHRGWELVVIRLHNKRHGTNIDYILRAHHDIDSAQDAIRTAYRKDWLFATRLTDASTYATVIEPATPYEIWPNVLKQWYGVNPVQPEDWIVDWGDGPFDHRSGAFVSEDGGTGDGGA